jgi:hypothetical protein
MTIAFVADVHLGNHKRHGGPVEASLNGRCRLALKTFRRAVERALALDCAAFVVAGDLFDYQRPEAQLIKEVQDILAKAKGQMRIYLLVGNHDQTSDGAGDHALGPLAPFATIIDQPSIVRIADRGARIDLALVPFRAGAPAVTWLPETLERLNVALDANSHRLLAVHLGIADENTPPWLRGSSDSINVQALIEAAKPLDVEAVIAGNWHDRKRWPGPPEVFQCGALVPTGWDNPGVDGYGTLVLWDGANPNAERLTYEEIPGPRFLQMSGKNYINIGPPDCDLFVSVTAAPEEIAAVSAAINAQVQSGLFAAAEVLPDAALATVAARTAATNASSAGTLDEAIARFVDDMPLENGVQRDDVRNLTRRYLGA